uniref:Cytochrome c oxidase assembly factor 5 n=1 Tax=Erpetoichthys calabaricus TaxID=27687 RepID=A0A8C4RG34_ERPCA
MATLKGHTPGTNPLLFRGLCDCFLAIVCTCVVSREVNMPQYYEGKVEEQAACAGVKEDLKACLLQHDCILREGKSVAECLKEGHCKALQVSFFECKRSILDNRARFRGRKGY